MERQLTLIDAPDGWKLDRRTREVGRRGVAAARAALQAAAERHRSVEGAEAEPGQRRPAA